MSNMTTFRLIGVRRDGTEAIIVTGMSVNDANAVQADPEVTGKFETTRIEPDESQPRQSWLTAH